MAKPTILTAIEAYESESSDVGGEGLASERADDLKYYNGELPAGSGLPDRSQVVSRDVSDAVERLKPALIRVFCSGDDVVSFNPLGQEDTDAAQQETDYVNYIITQKNDWFTTAYQWFDDALIQKNGYVKAWYDESEDITKETYKSQSDDQVAMLLKDEEVSILDMNAYPHPMAMMMPPVFGPDGQQIIPKLYDLTLQRKKVYGCVKYCGVPPERVRVYKLHKHVSLDDCEFVEHVEDKTLSQLRLEGFDVDDELSDEATSGDSTSTQPDEIARNRYLEDQTEDDSVDPSMRKVKVRECWIRFDEDGDGKAELRHVIVVGITELLNEETDIIPMAAVTPRIWSHRHIGMAIADFARDVQDIKTQMHRGLIDSVNYGINGRTGVNSQTVNLDDVLSSRPNGIVRVNGSPAEHIMPLVHQANFAPLMGALQYFDTVLEERTGANRASGQLNPEALAKLPSGIAISQIMSASQAPVELISRVFAETGVKSLFRIVHALTLKNARKAEIVRLKNKWVPVDPRQWKKRADMTISVGLGAGSKEQQAAALQGMVGLQMQLQQTGITDRKTLHHVLSKHAQSQGFKDTQSFYNDPQEKKQMPQQGPQVDPVKVKELQIKEKTEDGKLQIDAFNARTNRLRLQVDAQAKQTELGHSAFQLVQQGDQNAHGRVMDEKNLAASQSPGMEAAALRQESAASGQQVMHGLEAIAQALAEAKQRDEQILRAILMPRRRTPTRDPKTQRIAHVDDVPMETIQ